MQVGSDLRQDQLILQLLAVLDRLWTADGLELPLSLYKVVSTGPKEGLIEVVPRAETLASIHSSGSVKSLGAFSEDALHRWLQAQHLQLLQESGLRPDSDAAQQQWDLCMERFVNSCAGYCVATYVFGIADRHNDNIMLCADGKLFHIDFGHILGNVKHKLGVRRERAPFVLTKAMAHVMGGEGSRHYDQFVGQCCRAYNCVRRNMRVLTALLALVVSTGLPELTSYADLDYVVNTLSPKLSEEEAADKFKQLIAESLHSLSTTINHAIHIGYHYGI